MASFVRFALSKFSTLSITSQILNNNAFRTLSTATGRPENQHSTKEYDIIIVGGGLVGTTLACAISKNSLLSEQKVLLLEGGPKFNGFKGGEYGNRVSSVNIGSVKFFGDIGVWDKIAAARYKPVKQMQVWDGSSDALITFNEIEFRNDVAYIIENDLILDSVYNELASSRNVEIKNSTRIDSVELNSNGNNSLCLKDGEKLSCKLLIGADGANSLVRKAMEVDTYAANYDQMGLVATLELCDAGDNSVAWQRFIPTGPVALLPLNDTMSSLVWSTTPKEAKKLAALPPECFVDALNESFWKEYPQIDTVTSVLKLLNSAMGIDPRATRQYPPKVKKVLHGSRACFPLGLMHASSYVGSGVALVGDAAHRIHPLAGQGVNLGFGDVKCLTDALAEAVYAGAKIGDKTHLLKYEKERLQQNVPIMFGVHGLQKLYSTDFSPVVFLRSIGLQLTHNITPLKNMFMKRAMG